jgi:hypothetical protein
MSAFHGYNVWEHPKLKPTLEFFSLHKADTVQVGGSPIKNWKKVRAFFEEKKPRVIAEFGVFRGGSSIRMAGMLDELSPKVPALKDSLIVSVDTWLLDLKYVWSAQHKGKTGNYFRGPTVAGQDLMYFSFMSNVMNANMTHRIVPLPSSSLNAIQAFFAHGLRIDFCYLDASHANPDVFLDLVGVWQILNPGGVIVADDYKIPAVSTAIHAFLNRKDNDVASHSCKRDECWIYKK